MPTDRKSLFEQDLAVLYDILVSPGPLSPQKVRLVAAPTVRRWLLDGEINRLAKSLGVQFELPALDTSPVFAAIAQGAPITFYLAGGIHLGGVPVHSMHCSSVSADQAPFIPVAPTTSLYSPGRFLATKRLFFDGRSYTAEQILLFVANKAGGVHLDDMRNPAQAELERAASYMTFGNPHNHATPGVVDLAEPGGPCLVVIPPERGNQWSALEIELLSAAQSLISVHCNGNPLLQFESSQ